MGCAYLSIQSFWMRREKSEATEIIEYQIKIIKDNWEAICDEAQLSLVDRNLFWQRQFLNPFIFEGSDFKSM